MAASETIGSLLVELTADGSEYFSEMTKVSAETENVAEAIVKYFQYAGAGVAVVLEGIEIESLKTFSDFQTALTASTANMRGMSDELREEMTNVAVQLSNEGTSSAEELGKAYGALALNGKDAQQALADITVADELATASHTDAITAANALAKAENAVGLSAKDAATDMRNMQTVGNTVTEMARLGSGSIIDMAGAVAQAGTTIRQLNGGLTEGAAIITTYTQRGQSAGEAASSLTMLVRSLTTEATKNAQMWKDFGIEIFDTAGKLKPMADIINILEQALGPLTDAEKKHELEMLGFQDRTVAAVQSLVGMSAALKENQTALTETGEVMHTVAETQMETMGSATTRLYNNLKNLLLMVGHDSAPYMSAFADTVKDATDKISALNDKSVEFNNFMTTTLVVSLKAVIITALAVVVALQLIATTVNVVLEAISKFGDGVAVAVTYVNDKIQGTAVSAEALRLSLQKLGNFSDDSFVKNMASIGHSMEQAFTIAGAAWKAFGDKADTIRHQQDAAAASATAAASVYRNFPMPILSTGSAFDLSAISISKFSAKLPETVELLNSIKTPTQQNTELIARFNTALASGQVTLQQYNQAMDKLALQGSYQDPFGKELSELNTLNQLYAEGSVDVTTYTRARTQMLQTYTTQVSTSSYQNQITQLKQQLAQELSLQESYYKDVQRYQNLSSQEIVALKQAEATKIKTIQTQLAQATVTNQLQLDQEVLASAQTVADGLTQVFDQTTTAGKVAYVLQKAIAIASAIVNTQLAATKALAEGGYVLGIPMAVAIEALGMASVGVMIGTDIAGFEGGGMTADGPRVGGVDGKGGKLAVLHPNEKVTDLEQNPESQTSASDAKPSWNININNQTDSSVSTTPSADGKTIDILIKKAAEAVGNDIATGKGPVSKAMSRTYVGIRRGARN